MQAQADLEPVPLDELEGSEVESVESGDENPENKGETSTQLLTPQVVWIFC
ncbi:hypothetical protein AN958_04511 [Leucoagaricus sp. SymC.cos]|nr:hypothetical protein AN958_04511 [Leucoagaricus sp. SymC.cos]